MFRILLLYFWPVLIPLLLYTLWFLWARTKVEHGEDPLQWTKGPWFKIIISSLVVAVLCFLTLMFVHVSEKADYYQPAIYKDGKLIPAETR